TAKGGSFYNHALQVTSSFFCKKEAQKEVSPVVVEEVKQEVAAVVVPVEVEEESAPVTNFESLRNNFMAKFKTTWEDTE
ncbi:hypothetical protein U0B20_27695, partial [Escherichia coli]|nr:hypothetical protein [Escherichia coli]